MSEAEAQRIVREDFDVSRETMERLGAFAEMVIAENAHQNLISAATIPHIWQRHILDSVQLIRYLPRHGAWLDLGSGAGFPGIVLALVAQQPIILVESRRKRVAFLQHAVDIFGLTHVRIHGGTLESLATTPVSGITARAFAPLPKLFALAHRFALDETLWVLPKGKRAQDEVDALGDSWHGMFHVEHSLSDDDAGIIIAKNVKPRGWK